MRECVAPRGDDSVGTEEKACLRVEGGHVQPVDGLRDGDEVDGVWIKESGRGEYCGVCVVVFDVDVRSCVGELSFAAVGGDHFIEHSGQGNCSLAVACADVPCQGVAGAFGSDETVEFRWVSWPCFRVFLRLLHE